MSTPSRSSTQFKCDAVPEQEARAGQAGSTARLACLTQPTGVYRRNRDFDQHGAASRRCPRGQRLIAHVPHGHWKTITFVAGLRRRAVVAPLVLDGPMNATIFVTYLKECLAPKLKRGDVVIMDNLPVHRVAAVREVIEEAGAKLRYLPKYSPDLNPIEQAVSKLKAHLRKAAERTIPRLSRKLATLWPHSAGKHAKLLRYADMLYA